MALTDVDKKLFEELILKQENLIKINALSTRLPENTTYQESVTTHQNEIQALYKKLNLNVDLKSNSNEKDMNENLVSFKEEFAQRSTAAPAIVQTDNKKALDDLIQLYNSKFMENGAYKKGYAQPQVEKSADGKQQVRFEFPDDKSLMAFARELANPPKNKSFTVLDEKGNVLAHSTGDGKLYHGANDPKSSNKQAIEPGGDFQRPKPPAPADTTPKPT